MLTMLMFVAICMGGIGFFMSQKRSAEMFAMATLTRIILNQQRNYHAYGNLKLLIRSVRFVPREPAVPASVPVLVVAHEVSSSATLASQMCSRNFFAFYLVHGVDALLYFLLLWRPLLLHLLRFSLYLLFLRHFRGFRGRCLFLLRCS